MKALILHGTGNDHNGNWFPWLKAELEKIGYEVWVPDLPGADHPNLQKYTDFLLKQDWDFNYSLIIGHSSGSVEILYLLEHLPKNSKVNTAILVSPFQGGLGWESLKDLEGVEFDFAKIKAKADKFIVLHSDDDPNCPIEGAREIAAELGAEMKEFHGMQHFSINNGGERFKKFPELLEIIKSEVNKNT